MSCEYCEEYAPIAGYSIAECETLDVHIDSDNAQLDIKLRGNLDDDFSINIKYCPKCGEHLGEDKPLTLEELKQECELMRETGKERWLWLINRTFEGRWEQVSTLSKYFDLNTYLKDWKTYKHKPKEGVSNG